jgi:hypothetical protein
MAIFITQANKPLWFLFHSEASVLQRRKGVEERRKIMDKMKKEKAFIHNFLPSIMIYYTHVITFRVNSLYAAHSCITGPCVSSSTMLVAFP